MPSHMEDKPDKLISGFINPLAWIDVDMHKSPTADNATRFLCARTGGHFGGSA